MKKLFAFAMTSAMLIACGDDNSSSADDQELSSSSEEVTIESSSDEKIVSSSSEKKEEQNSSSSVQEANSSSDKAVSSSSVQEASSSVSTDFGEGYTYAIAHRYDEATGIMYQRIETCNYHPSTKTFAWEENAIPLDSNRLTVIGDSMWIGPVEKTIADDPDEQQFYDAYENRETLLLSTDHNGIYGKWKMTGCTRTYGETEFKCTSSIGGLKGIARTITITQDSVYNTTSIDPSNMTESKLRLGSILANYLDFDISDFHIDSLVEAQVIKVVSNTEFSVGSQTFVIDGSYKFDQTGMNFYETFSSNGKTCTKHEQLGAISKEQCLEGNADFLLSARDSTEEALHYKDGPVDGFSTDNREEYYECIRSNVTGETKRILSSVARN